MPRHDEYTPDRFLSSLETEHLGTSPSRHHSLMSCARDRLCLVRVWQRRVKDRRELAGLTDMELHDFGVTRYDARGEYGKPFWRA